jgi:hypothetical protein
MFVCRFQDNNLYKQQLSINYLPGMSEEVSEIVKYYYIVLLKRGNTSNKVSALLQNGWLIRKGQLQ